MRFTYVSAVQNSRQLPVLSSQEKQAKVAELSKAFPVSSGTQHRDVKDEWVPVDATAAPVPSPNVLSSNGLYFFARFR